MGNLVLPLQAVVALVQGRVRGGEGLTNPVASCWLLVAGCRLLPQGLQAAQVFMWPRSSQWEVSFPPSSLPPIACRASPVPHHHLLAASCVHLDRCSRSVKLPTDHFHVHVSLLASSSLFPSTNRPNNRLTLPQSFVLDRHRP